MKYKGNKIQGPQPEIVAFPRTKIIDGKQVVDDLVFLIHAVLDFSPFTSKFPEPLPNVLKSPNGESKFDVGNKEYQEKYAKWQQYKMNWMFLQSIKGPSEGDLEWEQVESNEPDTWANFREELKEAKLTPSQIQHLLNSALNFNSIDDEKMLEARNRFLATTQSLK